MASRNTDTGTPPPLKAIGGWASADWFCPTVLTDAEVVGITFPKLPGSRKQSFRLVERSAAPPGKTGQGAAATANPVKRALTLTDILDEYGAAQAASFRRTTFLFEAAPVLYFAGFPPARLKLRAADNLRRALIGNLSRGCILRIEPKTVLAMFWPASEHEITAFVGEAAPPYALHAHFDQPEAAMKPAGASRRGAEAGPRATRPLETGERDALLQELAGLRTRIAELQRSQSALGAMETLGLDDARLKSMLRLLHPDRHGGSEAANEAAKWVNNLRDMLKSAKPQS